MKIPSIVRKILTPVIRLRRSWNQREQVCEQILLEKMSAILAADPIVRVNGIGKFVMPATSELFHRLIRTSGNYEPEHLDAVREHINPRLDAIDLGANVGFYSVFFAKLLNEQQRVLAIEPTPAAFERLKHNLQLNHIKSGRVIPYQAAASDVEGVTVLNCPPGKEEYSSIAPIIAAPELAIEKIEVETIIIDKLVAELDLKPGFIKIDTEGSEFHILNGAIETIKKYKPIILVEDAPAILEAAGIDRNAVSNRLEEFGYTHRSQKTRGNRRNLWLPRSF